MQTRYLKEKFSYSINISKQMFQQEGSSLLRKLSNYLFFCLFFRVQTGLCSQCWIWGSAWEGRLILLQGIKMSPPTSKFWDWMPINSLEAQFSPWNSTVSPPLPLKKLQEFFSKRNVWINIVCSYEVKITFHWGNMKVSKLSCESIKKILLTFITLILLFSQKHKTAWWNKSL